MSRDQSIATKRFRRLYYGVAALLIILTVGSIIVPTYMRIREELATKIDQLSEGIVDQKKAFLEAVIVEKISDIERTRACLESEGLQRGGSEFDRRFRAEVRDLIHATELPDDGYIWINEVVDFEGGDDYAIRFAHPNLPDTEGTYLSTSTQDIAGNLPYLEELEGVRQNGEIFFDYYFKKMGSELISHKLSFAKLYEPYDWVVATGVYLDDVDALVEVETQRMVESTSSTIRSIVVAIVLGSALLLLLTGVFEARIRRLVDSYVESERSRSAELLKEKTKLEEVNRQKDRLFSVIAHDLANPIANVQILSGYISAAVDEPDASPDSVKEVSEAIGTSVESVQVLLDDLLTWARSQRDSADVSPAAVPASDHIEAAISACETIASSKGVTISSRVSSEPVVSADINTVSTVLRNLITNAVKFTEAGGSVTVSAEPAGEWVRFRIRDTGVGMTDEQIATLFSLDSVRSARGTNNERGTGFGLVLCKEFVDSHGGTIEVTSAPGEGSEFAVTFPMAPAGAMSEDA